MCGAVSVAVPEWGCSPATVSVASCRFWTLSEEVLGGDHQCPCPPAASGVRGGTWRPLTSPKPSRYRCSPLPQLSISPTHRCLPWSWARDEDFGSTCGLGSSPAGRAGGVGLSPPVPSQPGRAQLNVLEAHSEMLCEMLQTWCWHGESRAEPRSRAGQLNLNTRHQRIPTGRPGSTKLLAAGREGPHSGTASTSRHRCHVCPPPHHHHPTPKTTTPGQPPPPPPWHAAADSDQPPHQRGLIYRLPTSPPRCHGAQVRCPLPSPWCQRSGSPGGGALPRPGVGAGGTPWVFWYR